LKQRICRTDNYKKIHLFLAKERIYWLDIGKVPDLKLLEFCFVLLRFGKRLIPTRVGFSLWSDELVLQKWFKVIVYYDLETAYFHTDSYKKIHFMFLSWISI
jgi:hypothetical protein